jgi:hypothetical protein
MIIKSQDGDMLVNTDNISYLYYEEEEQFCTFDEKDNSAIFKCSYSITAKVGDSYLHLGVYSTEQQVKEIIKSIANCMCSEIDIYSMDEDEKGDSEKGE